MFKIYRIQKSRVGAAVLLLCAHPIHLFYIIFSAEASQQRRATSHSKVRQCCYLTLIVMGKSTIKVQTERNTIELADAFDVHVQIIVRYHNFSDFGKEKWEFCAVLYLLQNLSFRHEHSVKHLACANAVPNTARNMCEAVPALTRLFRGMR